MSKLMYVREVHNNIAKVMLGTCIHARCMFDDRQTFQSQEEQVRVT